MTDETRLGLSDRSVSMERKTVSDRISDLSIATDALSRTAEEIASDASYRGTELQLDGLLRVAGELRSMAAEIEAMR